MDHPPTNSTAMIVPILDYHLKYTNFFILIIIFWDYFLYRKSNSFYF